MQKKTNSNLLQHFLAIGSGTVINMILGFISTPIITRLVDPDELGRFSIFDTYSNIALMILLLGLDQALVRFFYDKKTIEYKQSLLKLCITVPTLAGLVVFLLVLSLAFCGVSFKFSTLVMALLCGNVMVLIWNRIATLLLRLNYNSKVYALCNILHRAVYIIAVLSMSWYFKKNYFIILITASIVSMLVPTLVAIRSQKEYWILSERYTEINKRDVFRYCLPLVFSMGLSTLSRSIDKLSLDMLCGYTEVGIYTSAQTLVGVFAIIQTTFNALWAPIQIEHYTENPKERTFFQRGNQYISVVMVWFGLTLILCKDLFVLILGEKYRMAGSVLPFLAFEPIMYTITETTHTGLSYAKKSWISVFDIACVCILNYIGNTLLVPILGIKGAAISTGISYIVYYVLETTFSLRYFYVDYKLKKFTVIVLLLIVYSYINTFHNSFELSLIAYIFISTMIFILYRGTIKQLICFGKNQVMSLLGRH